MSFQYLFALAFILGTDQNESWSIKKSAEMIKGGRFSLISFQNSLWTLSLYFSKTFWVYVFWAGSYRRIGLIAIAVWQWDNLFALVILKILCDIVVVKLLFWTLGRVTDWLLPFLCTDMLVLIRGVEPRFLLLNFFSFLTFTSSVLLSLSELRS